MKTHFTREDFERAFGTGSFFDKHLLIDTFTRIFTEHPPGELIGMPPARLDSLIKQLAHRDDVREVQETIASEIRYGEENLQHLVFITFGQLQKLGIAPQDKKQIYYKPYQEVWAYCGTDIDARRFAGVFEPPIPIAKGLFDPQIPLENIFFTPENTFYSDLSSLFGDRRLACGHGHKDVMLRKAGALHVYRDNADDSELTSRVKAIIRNTSDRIYRRIKNDAKRYETGEGDIVDELYKMFKSLKTAGSINYTKVYKIFEWILRENIDISQLIGDPNPRKILREEIGRYVKMPYAAIRARSKAAESEFLAVLRALYNATTGDTKDPDKQYKDRYAFRVIVPKAAHIFALVKSFKGIVGLEVKNEEDYVTQPKPNGYRSYHLTIMMGDTPYESQIRTHQMDRDAEKNPAQAQQAHDLVGKLKALELVPFPVKAVVATVYGI